MSRSQYPVRFVTALEIRQQEGAEQGDTFTESPGEVTAETTDDENDPGWSGQGTPGLEQVSNDNSESNSHKSTDEGRRTPRSQLCARCQREEDRKQDSQSDEWAEYECPNFGQMLALAEGRECPSCQSDRYQLVDGEHVRVGTPDIDELFGGSA